MCFEDAGCGYFLTMRLRRSDAIRLDNDMTLSIMEHLHATGDHATGDHATGDHATGDRVTERGLVRDFNVRLEGERLDLEEYLQVITTFQDLASIGTDRTSTFEQFHFCHPDIVHERQ